MTHPKPATLAPARLHRVGAAFIADSATVTARVRLGIDVNIWYGVRIRGDDAPITIGRPIDNTTCYVVDPRDGAGWPEAADLVCVRLDPVNGPCAVDVLRFAVRLRAASG